MSIDPPENPTPPTPEPTPLRLDVSKPPPSELATPLRILVILAFTLIAANVAFFGTCFCTADMIGSFDGAMAASVLASVVSAGGVLYALWPRKKIK